MATIKQITANRLNGKKGGPKTPAGKARSSKNAITHGLSSLAPLLNRNWHDETIEEREHFREKMMLMLDPHDELLQLYADGIIDMAWRNKRYIKIEEAVSLDTFIKLQLGDTAQELTIAETQSKAARRTVDTLRNDIDIIEKLISSDSPDPQNSEWWIDLIHARVFLEKSLLFGTDNTIDSPSLIPIAESIDTIVEALCNDKKITRKTLMENFLEYLQEQCRYWNTELRRLSASHQHLLNLEGREVTESSYILEVASHSVLQQSQGLYIRSQQTFFRKLEKYKKLNMLNDVDRGKNIL